MKLCSSSFKRLDCGHVVNSGEDYYYIDKDVRSAFNFCLGGENTETICKKCYMNSSKKTNQK